MKAKKTFGIGESCKGGVITAEVNGKQLTIIGREFDYTKKKNQQQNAKEWFRKGFQTDARDGRMQVFMTLTDLTTSYYADQIMDWANTKGVDFQPEYSY